MPRPKGLTTALLTGGVVAGPLFVAVFLIEGATRPAYDPMRLPVSLLSTGADGWTQVANFIVDGLLLLGFALGLDRALDERRTPSKLGPLLLALFALGVLRGRSLQHRSRRWLPARRPPTEPAKPPQRVARRDVTRRLHDAAR